MGMTSRIITLLRSLVLIGAFVITVVVYQYKIRGYFYQENRHRQNIEVYNYARKIIEENKILLYSEEAAYNVYFVTLSGAIPFYKPASYKNNLQWQNYYYDLIHNKINFKYSQPLTLLVKINHSRLEEAREFLDLYQAKTVLSFGRSTLYQFEFD